MNVHVPLLNVGVLEAGELAGVHRANRQLLTNKTHPPNRIIFIAIIVLIIKSV
jgi:hypothetical protein